MLRFSKDLNIGPKILIFVLVLREVNTQGNFQVFATFNSKMGLSTFMKFIFITKYLLMGTRKGDARLNSFHLPKFC